MSNNNGHNNWVTNIGITILSGSALWLCQVGYSGLERLARIEEQTKVITREVEKGELDNSSIRTRMDTFEVRLHKLEQNR